MELCGVFFAHSQFSHIMIPFLVFPQHQQRQDQSHYFRQNNREPDAVQTENQRQNKHGNSFEHERTGSCQHSRDNSIVERSEKRRNIAVKTRQQERNAVDAKSHNSKFQQIRIITCM